MAKMIPSTISSNTKSSAERKFFEILQNTKGTEDWIAIHSINIPKHVDKVQGEADFVVLIPKLGIFVVEVKGGRISTSRGNWYTTNKNNETNKIDPINEANGAMHSLMKYVNEQLPFAHSSIKDCLWGYCLAFTDSFSNDFSMPDIVKEQIADKNDMYDICSFFSKLSNFQRQQTLKSKKHVLYPAAEQCQIVCDILRPFINFSISLSGQIETVEKQIITLTDNQSTIFEGLAENKRCLIRGGAGTGKTIIALNYYKQLKQQTSEIGFFCYNKQLASYLQDSIETNYSCCFHGYMESIAKQVFPNEIEIEKEKGNRYYLEILPKLFINAFKTLNLKRFDFLIIDEAQDLMSEYYLDAFDTILYGGIKDGKWLFFMDADNQNLYSTSSYQEIQELLSFYDVYYTKYFLKDNCRNSVAIIEQVDKWFGGNTRHKDVQEKGTAVSIETYRHEEHEAEVFERTLSMLTSRFPTKDIVVLSPNKFEKSIASKNYSNIKISTEHSKNSVYFSSISAFKGLESKIILLCDISDLEKERTKKLLYVGMTRAKSALYVIIQKRSLNLLSEGE